MSPALNGSSAIRCFEGSDAIEMRDGITFDFYTGLPHILWYSNLLHGSGQEHMYSLFFAEKINQK